MQKKILISFAMSGLAAFPALADVQLRQYMVGDLSNNGWVPTGMEEPVFKGTGISCGVGVGDIVKTISLPKGDYTFTFDGLVNADVTINGQAVPQNQGKIEYKLTLAGTSEVVVTVKAHTAGIYSFNSFSLVLNFDVEGEYNILKAQYDDIVFNVVNNMGHSDVLVGESANLAYERSLLDERKAAILTMLNNIAASETGETETSKYYGNLKYYTDYKLFNTPNDVQIAIDKLVEDVNAYNHEVKALNDKYYNYDTNKRDFAKFTADVTDFLTRWEKIDAIVRGYDLTDDYQKSLYDQAAAINARIVAFKQNIDATYATEEDFFKTPNTALQAEAKNIDADLTTLQTNVDNSAKDVAAYNTFYGVDGKKQEFDKLYREVITVVGDINKDKEDPNYIGYAPDGTPIFDVFNDYKAAQIQAIDDLYKPACATVDDAANKTIAGFAARQAQLDKIVADASKAMKQIKDATVTLTTEQRKLYSEGCEDYMLKKQELDKLVEETKVPEDYQLDLDSRIAAARAALKAINDYYVNGLKNNPPALEANGADNLNATFDLAVDQIKNLVDKNQNPVVYLTNALEEARRYVENETGKAGLTGAYEVDVNGKFADTYASIEAAIEAYREAVENEQTPTATVDDIDNSIGKVKENADKVILAFKAAKSDLTILDGYVRQLNTWAAGKTVLPGSDKEWRISMFKATYMTNEDGLETKYAAYLKQYQDAAAIAGYKCVEAAEKVTADVNAYGTPAKAAVAEVALVKAISGENKDYVTNLVEKSKTDADAYAKKYAALGGLGFTNFEATWKKVYDKVDALLATADAAYATQAEAAEPTSGLDSSYQANWAGVDSKYNAALTEFASVEKAFNDLVANMKAYEELLYGCGNIQTSIDWTRTEYVNNSPTPEAIYFYQKKLDDLSLELSTLTYNVTNAATSLTAVAQRAALEDEITSLNGEITALQTAIAANTNAYKELFALGKTIRNDIDRYLQELNANIYSHEAMEESIEALENMRDGKEGETLYTFNQEILNLTNVGEISENLGVYTEKLQNLQAEAKALYDKSLSEYNANVIIENEEKYTNWKNTALKSAQDDYLAAVEVYKSYEGIQNKGLKEYLAFSDNSESVYKYNALIRKVDEDLVKKIQELNAIRPNARVITEDQLKAYTDELATYEAGIASALQTTNDAMNAKAQTYYADRNTKAQTAYNTTKALLEGAGIDVASKTSVFKPITDALNLATTSYNTNQNNPELTWKYMSSICDNLDIVIKAGEPEGIQGLAQAAWKQVYDVAAANQTTWSADIEVYSKFADPALYNTEYTNFINASYDLDDANSLATADPVLISNYATYLADLNAAVATMKTAHDLLKDSYEKNVESQNLYNKYIGEDGKGGLVADAQAKFNEIMNVAGDLLARDADAVKAIQTAINNMWQFVRDNSAVLYQKKAELITKMADVDNAVANGYLTVKKAEIGILLDIVKDVKDSFNKKKVDGGFDNNVELEKEYEGKIKALEDRVNALNGASVADAAAIDKFRTDAAQLESDLCDLNNELNPTQYPAQALETLNAAYDKVAAALQEAETALSTCTPEVQEKYAETYPKIRTRLEAIKAAYEAEGNKVSYLVNFYTPQLDTVNADIATEVAKVKKSNDNQLAFNGLDTDLTKYQTEFDALSETIQSLIDSDDADNWLDYFVRNRIVVEDEEAGTLIMPALSDLLTITRTQLDSYYKGESLVVAANANAIRDNLNSIQNQLLQYDMKVMIDYSKAELDDAQQAIAAARQVIDSARKNLVPDTYKALLAEAQELQAAYDELKVVWTKIYHEYYEVEPAPTNFILWDYVKSLKEAITGAGEVEGQAKALQVTTEESKWKRGDVNLNPDGIVNIIDVQMIITWVGKNTTYQDLYDENARQAMAADINGDNKLNIADVTGVIGIANNPDQNQPKKIGAPYLQDANGNLGVRLVSEENGVRRYAIYLSNDVPFVAGQLDFVLAPGMSVAAVEAGERAASHDFYLFDNTDFARVIVASMENAEFEGSTGIVGYVDIEGEGKFSVENIIFSDSNTVTYRLKNVGTTKIDDVIDTVKNGIERIYNAAGQQFNKLQKGINIIRHKDGTTTKEMNKD